MEMSKMTLVLCLLVAVAAADIFPDVSVSDIAVSVPIWAEFGSGVFDFAMSRDEADIIYVLDMTAVWKVDLKNKVKKLISGSDLNLKGYQEGEGKNARFNRPRNLLAFIGKLVISDTSNDCLRDVDLTTYAFRTSTFAGKCKYRGFTNGEAVSEAQLNAPTGLLEYQTGIIVADQSNNAIRFVKEREVTTLMSGSKLNHPAYLALVGEDIYATIDTGLLKLDLVAESIELIAGSLSEYGSVDDSLLKARFNYAKGIMTPALGYIIISDYNSNRMRLVDLRKKTVTSICTGTEGEVGGTGDVCKMTTPWAARRLGSKVLVGEEEGKIRIMDVSPLLPACPASYIRAKAPSANTVYADVELADVLIRGTVGRSMMQVVTTLIDGTVCSSTIDIIAS